MECDDEREGFVDSETMRTRSFLSRPPCLVAETKVVCGDLRLWEEDGWEWRVEGGREMDQERSGKRKGEDVLNQDKKIRVDSRAFWPYA